MKERRKERQKNEWVNERPNERTNGRTCGRTDRRTDGRWHERTIERTKERAERAFSSGPPRRPQRRPVGHSTAPPRRPQRRLSHPPLRSHLRHCGTRSQLQVFQQPHRAAPRRPPSHRAAPSATAPPRNRHCGLMSATAVMGLATLALHRNTYVSRRERTRRTRFQHLFRGHSRSSAPTQRTLEATRPHGSRAYVNPTRLSTN